MMPIFWTEKVHVNHPLDHPSLLWTDMDNLETPSLLCGPHALRMLPNYECKLCNKYRYVSKYIGTYFRIAYMCFVFEA